MSRRRLSSLALLGLVSFVLWACRPGRRVFLTEVCKQEYHHLEMG